MKLIKEITVNTSTDIRLVEFLLERSDLDYTKSALKKLFRKNLITINKNSVNTNSIIKENDLIEIFEDTDKGKVPSTNIVLKIIYEDDFLAAIYKEAGILVSGNKHKTIANSLAENLVRSIQKDALEVPVPVHRLDFPTSGVLLIAKTKSAREALFSMFENKTIKKEYLAVCPGNMIKNGIITEKIEGKESTSYFEILKKVESNKFNFLNLVSLRPETGRRHQLRIHLKSIGNPILGDKLYGDPSTDIGKGLFLHAYKISFSHPITKELLEIKTEMPSKFKKLL